MGLNEGKELHCTVVFELTGPRGGLCVGFTKENPPEIPPYDTIHLCRQSKEQLERSEKLGKCFIEMYSMTAEEAMRLGASLIQAAGFYKASKGEALKLGFYAEKWE